MNTGNHEQNETAAPAAPGGWEPIPQSEGYDEGATAFVHLPPEFMLDGVPLEAPGHGYTPPMIVPLQPLAQPAEGVEFFAPEPGQGFPEQGPEPHGYGDESAGAPVVRPYVEHDPHATAEWHFGGTGQWELPADGLTAYPAEPVVPEMPVVPEAVELPSDVPPAAPLDAPLDVPVAGAPAEAALDASPEPVSYEQAPPTLPGGAPAPWAVPEAVAEPVTEPAAEPEPGPEPEPDHEHAPAARTEADAAVVAAGAAPDAPVPSYTSVDSDEHPHTSYVLRVNGADRPVTDSWIGESLLYVLRERLGLAGAKDGCSQGECGACNVQVDGRLVASCLVPAATTAGCEVRTVEGLAVDGEPSDVQRALSRCGTVQCGFCIPGMCMTVHDLLEGNHAPTELETRQALAGNLCRCSGYKGVLQAVEDVIAERAAGEHVTAGEDDASARIPHQHDGGRA
ncbi:MULTISPECIES: (2Fe-2S)-binding protein [Streptomyces]|uniref:2Fe-2S iron-sulfur cluster-binding protein n=2 Tax=Streptomyces TaxID=1883 RepID=A0ABU4K590_9ACTN|nr:2Fe-2S iron-sulfur cluster-binding protein [Streptomyces roseolus]MDX2292919.1 2Fe-2S iron-sulfur cluster-binding protein [Streptomyces roseolus]